MKSKIEIVTIVTILFAFGCTNRMHPIHNEDKIPERKLASKQETTVQNENWINVALCDDQFSFFEKSITIKAFLVEYNNRYPWFAFEDGADLDGEAPYGLFEVLQPEDLAGRKVGIIFRYIICHYPPEQFLKESVNGIFTFSVPRDFFEGNYVDIDNTLVGTLKRIE